MAVPGDTHRLVPARYPPVAAFETVAHPGDLDAVMELAGWTDDRLVRHRLARLSSEERVFGRANASVVMAAFLYAAPAGNRFSGPDLGAWYAAVSLNTAIAEVAHHLRREMANAGLGAMRQQVCGYRARLERAYLDLRGADRPDLYAPADYGASQAFGEAARAAGESGMVYDSLRHRGGTNVVCYRPRAVQDVRQGEPLELDVRPSGRIAVRRLRTI